MKGRHRIEALPPRTRRWMSPVLFGLYREIERRVRCFKDGRLLDVGAGSIPYRSLMVDGLVYETLDLEERGQALTYVADAQHMDAVPSQTYDYVLCSEVLEHVADPHAALAEIARVLKPGGNAVITVPHLSRLHEVPNDFTRWTAWGLREMLDSHGFQVGEISPTGGLFTFLVHQVALLWIGSAGRFRVLGRTMWWLPAALFVGPALLLDRLPLMDRFPVGYVVLVTKD